MENIILGFPFEQIGGILRNLSLSGSVGNVIAIIIYILLSLSPVIIRLLFIKKKRLHAEDVLLMVLSGLLFGTFYLMINPMMLREIFGEIGTVMNGSIFGACIYSVLVGYFLLGMLRRLVKAEAGEFKKCVTPVMWLMNIMYVYVIAGQIFVQYLDTIKQLKSMNMDSIMNVCVISVTYIAEALPYVFSIFVVCALLRLFGELGVDKHSEGAVNAAGRLSRISLVTLGITIISSIIVNILKLLAAAGINHVKTTVSIPVEQIIFLMVALLIARYICENKKLKEDNDMFI